MDLSRIMQTLSGMFPSINLQDAVSKAQQALQGTPDNLGGVSMAANNLGLSPDLINKIYSRYGNTLQARTICAVLGTTPEALKADADRIVSGGNTGPLQAAQTGTQAKKFPRLK